MVAFIPTWQKLYCFLEEIMSCVGFKENMKICCGYTRKEKM